MLGAVATLAAVAAGCMGGGSHRTLSASEALARARADGFVRARRQDSPVAWWCDPKAARPGAPGQAHYVAPTYAVMFDDKRLQVPPDSAEHALMMVVVLPNDALAQRCAEGAIYQNTHIPRDGYDPEGDGPFRRYTRIDQTTVETSLHSGASPAFKNRDDGMYQTWIAHGRVFALGLAYNARHSKIVREDLERLASEIDS
jgi:hypothetical protein